MLKKLGILFITLSFATPTFAQNSTTPAALPPALPNPNSTVNQDPTHGAIIQPNDKKTKKTKKAKKAEKAIEAEVTK